MSPLQAPWDKEVLAADYRDKLQLMEGGDRVPDWFRCNGNTFVKDVYGKIDTTPAGIVHDWDFHVGGGWREFFEANARYRRNLRRCGLPRTLSLVRFLGVNCGVLHFNWR